MSKWTKKDYIVMAKTLQNIENKSDRDRLTNDMVNQYQQDNPNFDETVFRNAVNKTSSIKPSKEEKRRMNEFIRKTEDEKLKKELR